VSVIIGGSTTCDKKVNLEFYYERWTGSAIKIKISEEWVFQADTSREVGNE
jgi:hypothetical protein